MSLSCLEIYQDHEDPDYQFIRDHYVGNTMNSLLTKLENDQAFSYVRYGDLEWRIILENRGNVEHEATTGMQSSLQSILTNDLLVQAALDREFYLSSSFKLFKTELYHDRIKDYVNQKMIQMPLTDTDLFNEMVRYASPQYMRFLAIIKSLKIIIVSSDHFSNLSPAITVPVAHIVIPRKNCHLRYDEIKTAIINLIIEADQNNEKLTFLFACSAMAPIIIADLHMTYGGHHWFIDIGSLFDIFLGYASRRPSICAKEQLYQTYTACFSVPFEDILEFSTVLR